LSGVQLIEQSLRLLQITRIKPLGEPNVALKGLSVAFGVKPTSTNIGLGRFSRE
jgi:hypothetical protein